MAFTLYDYEFSAYVTCPAFQFGDSEEYTLHQGSVDTTDGHIAVIDRGTRSRAVSGLITGITNAERYSLRVFFQDTLQGGLNLFWISYPNQRSHEAWNTHKQMIYVGCTFESSVPVADGSFDASERISVDNIVVGPLRWRGPSLRFIEREGSGGGTYELSIAATIEDDT